jgi:outer membrane protein TolC
MNRLMRCLALAGLALLTPAVLSPCAAEVRLTLREAIERAYRNNMALQAQEKEVEAARARVREARSPFYPNLSAQAGYTH